MTDENMFQGGAVTAAEKELKRGKAQAQKAAEDLKMAGTSMAGDYRDKAEQAWGSAKAQAGTWRKGGEDYVRGNPIKTILTALGVGFVLGKILRR